MIGINAFEYHNYQMINFYSLWCLLLTIVVNNVDKLIMFKIFTLYTNFWKFSQKQSLFSLVIINLIYLK